MSLRKTLCVLSVLCPMAAFAEIKLPALYSHGAVLQRDRELTVWGWATPQQQVTVRFAEQQAQTQAVIRHREGRADGKTSHT